MNGFNGYLSSVGNLINEPRQWQCGGAPITMMLNIERRNGRHKPVIRKALVRLDDAPFKAFEKNREKWAMTESYISPGPIQYFGPPTVTDMTTKTLQYEQRGKEKL